MKKNNLFKAIGLVMLIYILISWIVPIIYSIAGLKGDVSHQIGFVSIVSVISNTFSGFGNVVFFVFLVGGFYGVLKATGAYDKMMNSLTENKNKLFITSSSVAALLVTTILAAILTTTSMKAWLIILISVIVLAALVCLTFFINKKSTDKTNYILAVLIILMTLISSMSGLDLGLLVVYPFLIGLVLKLGYDKITAVAATAGATLVGMYGALFANTMYGLNIQVLTTTKLSTGIVSKIILLVVGLCLLLTFTMIYAKKNRKAVKVDAKKESKREKESTKKAEPKKGRRNFGVLPAFITTGLLFLIFILGTTAWAGMFNVGESIFEKAHTAWTGWSIGGFAVLNKLVGGIGAFGSWFDPTRFATYSMLLLLAMVVIALFYGKGVKDTFDGFVDGLKSFIIPVIITVLVCSIFVFVYYNPVITPVTQALLDATKGFNVTLASLYTLISSFFYVDYYYFAASTLVTLSQTYTDASVQSVLNIMYVSLYSVVMLVAPTSLVLMLALAISETKYTEWIKFIWILAVVLLLVAFVVLITMAHLIPLWAGIVIGVVVVAIILAIYAVVNHLI